MKQSILPILLSGLLLISCSRQEKRKLKTNQSSDEKQITTLAFYASVEPDDVFIKNLMMQEDVMLKSYKSIIKDPIQRHISINEEESRIDSLKKMLRKKSIFILIMDTLNVVSPNYFRDKLAGLNNNAELNLDTDSLKSWWREIQITHASGNFQMMNIVRKYHPAHLLEQEANSYK